MPAIFGGNFTFDGQKGGMARQGRPFGLFSPKEMTAGLARTKKKTKKLPEIQGASISPWPECRRVEGSDQSDVGLELLAIKATPWCCALPR